jgi:hypothetical protein
MELMNELHDAATSIAREPHSRRAGWVTYILEVLQDDADPQEYEAMLRSVKVDIETRLQVGRW